MAYNPLTGAQETPEGLLVRYWASNPPDSLGLPVSIALEVQRPRHLEEFIRREIDAGRLVERREQLPLPACE